MLTLYYAPGACSLATHIALCENNLQFNLQRVDLGSKKLADGRDYYTVNIKGYVPAIQLETGELLCEGAAILFYIAEQGSQAQTFNSKDKFMRYRLQEALTFVSSELHKTLGAFFDPKLPDEYKERLINKLKKRFTDLELQLNNTEYLLGSEFTVADAYCFTILRWLNVLKTGLSLSTWPKLQEYYNKIAARPKVKEAMQQENLER